MRAIETVTSKGPARSVATVLAILSFAVLAGAVASGAQTNGPGPAACLNLGPTTTPPPAVSWPPVTEQLARDSIQPGSTLARLVQAHQDFGRLRPGERKDGKPIPSWLRVLWRKAHPESRYVANDPYGGYPAVLAQLYRWMLHHQDLTAGPPPPSSAPQPASGASSESGQQRISGPQGVVVNDSDVRIDPLDPGKILVAANDPVGVFGRVAIFYSTDGGASWGQSSLPLGINDVFQDEGAVEWTADGTAWATAVVLTPINQVWSYFQLRAYTSTDDGKTWTFDALLSGSQAAAHRDRLWVDRGASSPFRDQVYAMWNDLDGVYFARRTKSDGAWHNAILLSDVRTLLSTEGAEAATNSAGEIFGFWIDGESGRIFVAKSSDGGVSFDPPVDIATSFGRFRLSLPAAPNTASMHVSGGAFRNATENQVYAAWADLSGEAGCKLWTEQPTFVVGGNACKSRLWFSRSADGGATWSPPVKIDHRPTLDDQFSPVLAVDESSGKLSLTYYDTVGDPSRKRTNLFYQSSSDGGTTWSDPLQVTTASTDETDIFSDPTAYGDHNGLSVVNGFIVPTWTDRRNGGREEIWSAAIADPDPCAGPAATGLLATPRPAGVDLSWDAVPGATYRVLRAPASGGPYSLIATTTLNGYFDAAGDCDVTRYYAVRAVNGCASALSAEVTGTGRPTSTLYSNDFESGSGLADWTAGAVPGYGSAADWPGIETCSAHSGSGIFRFGGPTCASGAGPGDDVVFAYPHGPNGIPIPKGATDVHLSFWHRRDFQPGSGGLLGIAMSDVLDGCLLIRPGALSGENYNAVIRSQCATVPMYGQSLFTGTSSSFTQTLVDLDHAFSDTWELPGSLAGHVVEPLFLGFTNCGAPPQPGWFVDDVKVTACIAPPAPAYGFYPLAPCRLIDTRQPSGPSGGPALGPSAARTLTLAGRCGVPPTAKALSVNLTVVQPAMAGSLLLYADDQTPAPPLASTISFPAGVVRANNAIVSLGNGSGGAIALNQSAGGVDLLIDVNGYFQ
ncbi:MAG TPA: hypothetical protein VFE33_35310 [Thermoanaerobaculia bacterium]|nr:hypothetical protein [Thermoanaerobaculia bacterium]